MIAIATDPRLWTPGRREAFRLAHVFGHYDVRPPGPMVDAALRILGISQAPAQPCWQYPFPPYDPRREVA